MYWKLIFKNSDLLNFVPIWPNFYPVWHPCDPISPHHWHGHLGPVRRVRMRCVSGSVVTVSWRVICPDLCLHVHHMVTRDPGVNHPLTSLTQGWKVWGQSRSDWPKMGQIRDFFISNFRSQDVLKSHFVPFLDTIGLPMNLNLDTPVVKLECLEREREFNTGTQIIHFSLFLWVCAKCQLCQIQAVCMNSGSGGDGGSESNKHLLWMSTRASLFSRPRKENKFKSLWSFKEVAYHHKHSMDRTACIIQ